MTKDTGRVKISASVEFAGESLLSLNNVNKVAHDNNTTWNEENTIVLNAVPRSTIFNTGGQLVKCACDNTDCQ